MHIDRQPDEPVPVNLSGIVSRTLAERPEWLRLCAAVRADAPRGEILGSLSCVRSALRDVGVSEELHDGIAMGLSGMAWDDAVDAFARSRGRQVNFYLGPMRAVENGPARMGLLVLERRPSTAAAVAMLEQASERIGKRMFGTPCSFMGRKVEFYDLTAAVGPFAEAGASSISLFTPFYFDGWKDASRQLRNRRSLLLHNVVRSRFDSLTKPFLTGLRVDGRYSSLLGASGEEIDDAFTLWLTLHELMHASGPMPLFAGPGHKLGLGMEYGPVEEMRTDMSAFVALRVLEEELGTRAELPQELILAERLLRSVRVGNALEPEVNGIGKSLDGEHGCLWGATLYAAGALRPSGSEMRVDRESAHAAIRAALVRIYSGEAAARMSDDAPDMLRNLAADVRGSLFVKEGPVYGLPAALQEYYRRVRGPDRMSFSFPDC